ncbi:hypothetical protein HMPREF9440_01331 [Sutterella parvirubra YIT 11816]|uniref:Uncharacterized protein n=1 Tax=Sutterella parvirubra YIT 11816 TaxID=762967 RepID=H3KF15_9BURK|nr:hypothetical protein HMPREF9440_01331 [Sutterella parvirubra YIT 11816]
MKVFRTRILSAEFLKITRVAPGNGQSVRPRARIQWFQESLGVWVIG